MKALAHRLQAAFPVSWLSPWFFAPPPLASYDSDGAADTSERQHTSQTRPDTFDVRSLPEFYGGL